jgi:hypothetical protein
VVQNSIWEPIITVRSPGSRSAVEVAVQQALFARKRERIGDVERVLIADPGGQVEDLVQAMAQQLHHAPVTAVDVRDADAVN